MVTVSRRILIVIFSMMTIGCQTSQSSNNEVTKKNTVAQINTRLGMAYLERHDIQRAKQKFLMALDQAPDIPETWYSMAYLLESTGNKEQARKYYQKAVEVAPERGDALNNYGTYLCRSGDYKGAVSYFIKATQDPKYLEQASAYENAGLCSLKIPDRTAAMAYFKRALAENPERFTSLIELSELNYKQGKVALARKQLDQYLRIAQPSAQSYLLEKKIDDKLSKLRA